jgi:hypothetical protein
MELINEILTSVIEGISHEHIVDMGVVCILTTLLLFIDATQRVAAEVLRYNKDNHRRNTVINLTTTLLWYGWGRGRYVDFKTGSHKRYLMSERLRSDLLIKLCVQYPAWMMLSVIFISLPDIKIPSTEIYLDHIFAFMFMIIPFLAECWSIIENLREIVEDDLIDFSKVYARLLEIIRAWRGNG